MDDAHIVVDSMTRISASDITYDLARESGFESVEDVLQIAGIGNNLMLPPPLWFWVASLAALIPASYVGARLVPERSSVTAASARI